MNFRPLRLHHRIVVSFAFVALVATSLAAYFTLSVAGRELESRLEAQVVNTAAAVSQSNFALNPVVLQSVKAIAGADVIAYRADGGVLATTLDARSDAALITLVAEVGRPAAEPPRFRTVECDGTCYVAYRRVAASPGTVVAVVARADEIEQATTVVARAIVASAFVSLVVMVLVSQALARRVTAPLDALVAFTREISGGSTGTRAATGTDDVGRLGQAFNEMLDRLDASRSALVRSEKLGLAGLFAARVAHDIRNPLSSIKMQTQLLRSTLGGRGDHNDAILKAVQRDIVQVESVVSDLLELSRPGELKREPVSINAVVSDVAEQVLPHLEYRKIRVERRLAEGLPTVMLDPARLRQALLNVVNNAADAMPAGGTLVVGTSQRDGGVEIEVCDDGVGIDPGVAAHVFDPFVTTKRDGVGLGLVNTKAVVESHGGRVALTAMNPRGTRAAIWLPAHS